MKEETFFKSEFHKYLYILIYTDESQWYNLLRVRESPSVDDWYNEILNELVINKNSDNHRFVNLAIEKLDRYYYNMIND